MADQKKAGASPVAPAKDLHGNPEGTSYTEAGKALPLDMGLIDLPEGKIYNEDGSEFIVPEGAETKKLQFKADITGLRIAVEKGENMKNAAQAMADAETDEAGKQYLSRNIASQQIAIDSNKAALDAKIKEARNFDLSLITPGQRSLTKELDVLLVEKAKIDEKIADNKRKMLIYGVKDAEKDAKPAGVVTPPTDVQTANREAAIKEHGTQGKAIVHLVKQGWPNHKIASHFGIPPASVPGPKNAFLKSAEGAIWAAANPTLAEQI